MASRETDPFAKGQHSRSAIPGELGELKIFLFVVVIVVVIIVIAVVINAVIIIVVIVVVVDP